MTQSYSKNPDDAVHAAATYALELIQQTEKEKREIQTQRLVTLAYSVIQDIVHLASTVDLSTLVAIRDAKTLEEQLGLINTLLTDTTDVDIAHLFETLLKADTSGVVAQQIREFVSRQIAILEIAKDARTKRVIAYVAGIAAIFFAAAAAIQPFLN